MTCIVGIIEMGGKVWIGGDSAAVGGYDRVVRSDEKVFRNGEFVIGFTSSFRMGQILRYCFTPPPINMWDVWRYMANDFIGSVTKAMKEHGWERKAKGDTYVGGETWGGTFLVGVRGHLFTIYSDFQIAVARDRYAAVGCGDAFALGAMWSIGRMSAVERAKHGLHAAAHFSAGVCAPFIMLSDRGDELRWGEPKGEVA